MLANFESVRRDLTPYEQNVTPDMTFQLGWPSSAVLLMTLIEELVYTASFDGRYRDAIKSRSEVVDVLQYPSIADRIKDVRDAIAQESVPIPERNATSAGTAGSAPAPTATEGTESGKVAASATTEKPNASGFDSLCEEDQTFWLKAMRKTVNTYIARISDTGSTSELKAKIQGCRMAMTAGDASGLVLFHFDIKKFGEATTRPDLRIAPLRDSSYVRLVSTVLAARRALSDADGASSASDHNLFRLWPLGRWPCSLMEAGEETQRASSALGKDPEARRAPRRTTMRTSMRTTMMTKPPHGPISSRICYSWSSQLTAWQLAKKS